MKTYIIGHIKPDLDSVVSAIAISEFLKQTESGEFVPAIVDSPNNETTFVFEKFNFSIPNIISSSDISPEDRVILVDHNEADQRLQGLNQDQIVGIFDHHKANLNLSSPIRIHILPLGSSCTVAWSLFTEKGIAIPKNVAELMLSAVLSDTVGLKSSTATESDKEAVSSLSSVSGISDIDALTLEIFKAKSNISSLSDQEIVKNDYKVFDFSGKKVLIGQIETVEQDNIIQNRLSSLLTALQEIKTQESVDLIFLAVTDILKVNTKLIVVGDEEKTLAEKAFGGFTENNIIDIGAKMSRKKDIAPAIESSIS